MDDIVNVRLEIPVKSIEIDLKLNNDDLVWNIKKNILNTIAPDLKDSLNYGFYQPSTAFKAAKYLDEDRSLREYNLEEGTTLQLIVKKKIYKASTLNTKKLKELNVKSNRKKFIQYIQDGTVAKVARLIDKGLDPNFIDTEIGECPLTLSAQLTNPQQIMTSLVEGGAHLDFRNRDGWTAMHRAAHLNNLPALQALLNFGASANYQDEKGLTPLYNSILTNSNPSCAGALLRDFALLGIVDGQGNTELHQACKLGRVQHLDLLISYGADLNCQNNTGNTPLHLCAMHNQEDCARMLLYRGADKHIRNLINQDPADLARFYKNLKLESIIEAHRPEDIVYSQDAPEYNDKSRSTLRKRSTGSLLTSKLSKISQSTPYLHQCLSSCDWGTLTRDKNSSSAKITSNPWNSVRSNDSNENSTGSADQQFEFDVTPTSSTESRPTSWAKQNHPFTPNNNNFANSANKNNNKTDSNTSNISNSRNYNSTTNIPESLREHHKPLRIFGNKNSKYQDADRSTVGYQRSQSNMPNNNIIRNSNNNNINIANNINNRLSMLRRQSCDDVLTPNKTSTNENEDVYCNGSEVDNLKNEDNNDSKQDYKRRSSLENDKPKILTPFKMAGQQQQQQKHQSKRSSTPTKNIPPRNITFPILPTIQQKSPNEQHSEEAFFPPPPPDVYLNGSEVDRIMNQTNKHSSVFSLPPRRTDNQIPILPPKRGPSCNLPDTSSNFPSPQKFVTPTDNPQTFQTPLASFAKNTGQLKPLNLNNGLQNKPFQEQNNKNEIGTISLKSPTTTNPLSPKAPAFAFIPPPPTFPSNFKTLASPTNSVSIKNDINFTTTSKISPQNHVKDLNTQSINYNTTQISNLPAARSLEPQNIPKPTWNTKNTTTLNNSNNTNNNMSTVRNKTLGPISPPLPPPPPTEFATSNDFTFPPLPPPPSLFNSNDIGSNSYNNGRIEQPSELLNLLMKRKNQIEQ